MSEEQIKEYLANNMKIYVYEDSNFDGTKIRVSLWLDGNLIDEDSCFIKK